LNPFNPEVVIQQLPAVKQDKITAARPSTPNGGSLTYTSASGDSLQVPITPSNVAQVEELIRGVCQGNGALDPIILQHIHKLAKGACKAIANVEIQQSTNTELLEAVAQNSRRSKRTGEHYGLARVMGLEVVQEREEWASNKALDAVWNSLLKLPLDLFQAPTKALPIKLSGRGNQSVSSCCQAILKTGS
jgi:hypothetical protein